MTTYNPLHEAALIAAQELSQHVKHVFVTGAGGFLGQAICRLLRAKNIKVTGFSRGKYPELSAMGVNMIQGDIGDETVVGKAMQGCDLIFHVASKAGVWGSKESYFYANVTGVDNMLAQSKKLNIPYFVYTSTPSVTFAGKDEDGIDESQPYASKFLNYYAESKAIAEEKVLANNQSALKTVALRPHLIWGPKDPHLVPRVISKAKSGRLKLLGNVNKLVDTIYVDNAAYAHILAAVELIKVNSQCAGKAYFISNDEPIFMATMLNKILACVNIPEIDRRIPTSVAYVVGTLLELLYRLCKIKKEPFITRFVVKQLSTSHYFDISAAKRDLGYQPLISIDEGMKRLKASLSIS